MRSRATGRGERGALSIALAAATLAATVLSLATADLGAMLVARARAQTAADAAALAAAVRQQPILGQPGDPTAAAREAAEENGARLLRCECAAGRIDAVAEVAVRPRTRLVWVGREARATARAEIDADVPTYRAGE